MPSWGSPLLDPKKLQNQQFYIIDWIRKKLLVDVANLATCCHDDYDVLLEVLGTLGKCYVSNPVAKTLVWIKNNDWHNCFWMSSWGSPLLDPKKLQNEQFYVIDWIRKKLLVDVANLATCCHDDYDVLLEVWEPCANAMLVVALGSQPFRQRARALAENNSARPEDFDPKTGKTQRPDWQHRPGVFFPYSIDYIKLLILKLFWAQ